MSRDDPPIDRPGFLPSFMQAAARKIETDAQGRIGVLDGRGVRIYARRKTDQEVLVRVLQQTLQEIMSGRVEVKACAITQQASEHEVAHSIDGELARVTQRPSVRTQLDFVLVPTNQPTV